MYGNVIEKFWWKSIKVKWNLYIFIIICIWKINDWNYVKYMYNFLVVYIDVKEGVIVERKKNKNNFIRFCEIYFFWSLNVKINDIKIFY